MAGPTIPRRTPEQKAEVGRFIDRLYELSGADSNVDFASRAGLYASNVGEYRAGQTMPDAYTLIRLMASVGVQLTARGEAVDLPAPPGQLDRQGDLRESVDELLEWQTTAIEQLAALDTRLAQLESGPVSQPSPPQASESRKGS